MTEIIDRFATHKELSLTLANDSAQCDFGGLGELLERSGQNVRIRVPRARVAETCRAVLTTCDVTDISVQEMPVEEVLRMLFQERTDQNAAEAISAVALP